MTTALLSGFEPSEADMIQMALDMPLETKINKAIAFFQTYCDGAYGAFSGGKDSCVIKQLAVDAGVKVDWYYNNTTIDAPELVQFIRKHHADVKWNNPKVGLLNRIVEKANPPTRLNRWCCLEYKEQGGNGRDKVIGVRIAESARRAGLWKQIVVNNKTRNKILCPIVYWTDADVWDYIKLRNLPYCTLYNQGFERLGCIGCPLSGSAGIKRNFALWPRFEKAWRITFKRTWDRWHNVPNNKGDPRFFEKFGNAEAFFQWWISGSAAQSDDQCVFEEMMEQK
jgi:phosphoadenosine phosphosulfate reductase